jgi:hypothetical protein
VQGRHGLVPHEIEIRKQVDTVISPKSKLTKLLSAHGEEAA